MADITAVSKQFVDYYYATFSANRSALQALYRPHSMLTFEGESIMGTEKVVEKLTSLPFQQVQHKITTLDAQPSVAEGSLLISVTGLLVVDGSENPLQFSQVFQLLPDAGSYYVFNDIFRLNYG
ncbi:nuclear transport factor 2 [Panaeolus papilionaceus]|nr:nuclear transport factor 2 [Panaeolus papilionaceus]